MRRGPGRPKKKASERKSAQIGVRVSAGLKRQLDAAASANGVPLSQEAADRLAMSFSTLSRRQEEFGDLTTYAFCRFLARSFALVREEVGDHWTKNAFAFRHVKIAADALFELMRPAGDSDKAPEHAPILETLRSMGKGDEHLARVVEILEATSIGNIAAIRTLRDMEKAYVGTSNDETTALEGLAVQLLRRTASFGKERENDDESS